jgi:alkylation response protein AidB-like acyl-CoA dehydrogenase
VTCKENVMFDALPRSLRELQKRVRAFVDEELIPHEVHAEMNHGELPPGQGARVKARVDALALRAMNIPAELGGSGLSYLAQAVVSEQIGRVTNGLGWCVTTPALGVAEAASDAQRTIWTLPTVRGERTECYAITEEGAGSDVDAIQTSARRDGKHYVLDGEKWHVTSYNHADHMIVQAKIAGGPNDGAHALFFVDVETPGVAVVRTPAYTHTYSHHHPIVALRGVRVPETNRIGAEGDGLTFTQSWFRYERLMIAARCCGAAERLIDEATAFARDRIVFAAPLSDYQAVRFMLADSLTELWAARLMVYRLAQAHDGGEDVKVLHGQCAMAKLYASEMANRVADRAVQIFGGRGYMRENVAERFFRELRIDRIWEGASEIQRDIIAGQLLKRGTARLTG